MQTSAREEALVKQIADYLDLLASDCEAFAQRKLDKRANTIRAATLRAAASDIREIKLV
jgi:hypothetical protein